MAKVLNLRFAYDYVKLVSRSEVIRNAVTGKALFGRDPESGEIICVGWRLRKWDDPNYGWNTNHQDAQSVMWDRVSASFSLSLPITSQSTLIGKENRDASGRHLDPKLQEKFSNLRKWDHILQFDSETRNLNQFIFSLRRCKEKLGLQYSVIEKTAHIYKKVQHNKMIRGRTTQAVLAACVYIACRQVGIPRTLNDVARANNITCKEISSAYRLIVLKFDLNMPSIDQLHYLVRLANSTGVGEKVKRHSIRVMKEIIKKELSRVGWAVYSI
jgi:transcription initiation factor TFIIB